LETALYLPVKRFLEKLGFTVKGEVGGCDLVALSGDDPPIVVIGELKLSFNLELILQAVDRAGAADEVWLAAKLSARGKGRESDARYRNPAAAGFGMLAVTNTGDVEVLVKPATTPAPQSQKRSRLSPSTGAQGRSRHGRLDARADHDGLSSTGAGLRVGAVRRAAARQGPAGRDSRCGKDPPAQRLWLVRPRRARHLCSDRCRTCRVETAAGFAR
jgi:hypothetical protein